METTCLVALSGLSLSGNSLYENPEMVSYVKQVSHSFEMLSFTARESASINLILASDSVCTLRKVIMLQRSL